MKKIIFLLAMVCAVSCIPASTEDGNEVDPKPPSNLDPVLRRALLKAITDLQNEDTETPDLEPSTEVINSNESTTEENEILETGDESENKIKNEISSTLQVPVRYHSFIVEAPKLFDNDTFVTSDVEKQEFEDLSDDEEIQTEKSKNEDIETKESNNSLHLSESRNSNKDIFAEDSELQNLKKAIPKRPSFEVQKAKPTTLKPTTTIPTTPKPKFNEDGENIEQLEDVQFFPAPLVAAFTVHQDENGLPKQVVPIFKDAVRQPIVPLSQGSPSNQNNNKNQISQVAQDIKTSSQSLNKNGESLQFQNQFFPTVARPLPQDREQLRAIQQQLEQKQRLLEEQLRELQRQQKQHEEILKQQQILQQQQQIIRNQNEAQRLSLLTNEQQRVKQQQFLDQQTQIQQQNLIRVNSIPQGQSLRQQNLGSTSVNVQPSISLQSSPGNVELQPPQKEAVDFLVHLRSKIPTLPLQNGIPIPPSPQQQLPLESPFQNNFVALSAQQSLLNQQLPIEKTFENRFKPSLNNIRQQQLPNGNNPLNINSLPSSSSTRVFRHDSSTGNFGLNTNHLFNRNQFNAFQPVNGVFRPQKNSFRSDDQLKSLIFQNGFSNGGKSQEDLGSIVSKILSLNHGIGFRNGNQ